MMVAVGSPVVYQDDDIRVVGRCTKIEGTRYDVETAIGAEWQFDLAHVMSGKLRVDDRPAAKAPYMWQLRGLTFCAKETEKTPHHCEFHKWYSSEPCDLCAKGDFFL